MRSSMLFLALVFGGAAASLHAFGCSSTSAPPTGAAGGPVSGAVDHHCTAPSTKVQPTNPASCHPEAGPPDDAASEASSDAASEVDAAPESAAADNPYGPTMFNAEGDDDDCKYHVRYSVTPIHRDENETLTVIATRKSDGKPATGGALYAEVFLSDMHPAPNAPAKTVETAPGTYAIGPIRFDASGQWTVRIHLFGDCSDMNDDSPHGHAAFFVSVP